MITLIRNDGDTTMSELVQTLDLPELFDKIGGEGTREVSTNAFIRALIERMKCTFEFARDVVYSLLESGKAVLTRDYTLRLVG